MNSKVERGGYTRDENNGSKPVTTPPWGVLANTYGYRARFALITCLHRL